jgi:hypothetical protein
MKFKLITQATIVNNTKKFIQIMRKYFVLENKNRAVAWNKETGPEW